MVWSVTDDSSFGAGSVDFSFSADLASLSFSWPRDAGEAIGSNVKPASANSKAGREIKLSSWASIVCECRADSITPGRHCVSEHNPVEAGFAGSELPINCSAANHFAARDLLTGGLG